VTDGLRMVVARPSNYGDMSVERQTPVEDESEPNERHVAPPSELK